MIKPPTWMYLIGLVLIIAWFNLFDDFHSFKKSTSSNYKGKEGMIGTSVPQPSVHQPSVPQPQSIVFQPSVQNRSSYCIPTGVEVNMYGSTVCCSGSAVQRGNQYFCK